MKSSAKAFPNKRASLLLGQLAIVSFFLAPQLVTGAEDAMVPASQNAPASPSPAANNPNIAINQSSEPISPIASDKQLAQQLTAVVAELDDASGPVRDVVNNAHNPATIALIQALESDNPVSTRTLSRARRNVRRMLAEMEKLKTLTAPSPSFIMSKRGNLVMDGKLDEPTWQRAAKIPIQYETFIQWKQPKATVRLLWDSQYLYAGFEVSDANIIAPVMVRDSNVWQYDCIELFLLPSQQIGPYWEIEISPTGSILDYLCYRYPGKWGDDFHTTETLHGLRIGRTIRGTANQAGDHDSGYTIELAVPFDQIPGFQDGAKKDSQLYALLCQVNNDSGVVSETSTSLAQVPYGTWFHNIWAYQPFKLLTEIPKPAPNK